MSRANVTALLEVFGAVVVVFLSWIVTNTISRRFGEAKATVDRATSEDHLRQHLGQLRRGQREVKATLSRLDLLVSDLNPDSMFSGIRGEQAAELRDVYGLVQTAVTSFFVHEDLQDAVRGVRALAFVDGFPPALHDEVLVARFARPTLPSTRVRRR